MSAPDRLALLLAAGQTAVTGIDFVFVDPNQVDLFVFFHHPDPVATIVPVLNNLQVNQIRIEPLSGGPTVTVDQIITPWPVIDGRRVLHLHTTQPGGFVRYRLTINDSRIDPFYNGVVFSFKANCPSDLDCDPSPHECAPEGAIDFPVDYRARDFWSLRQELIDFASERYPGWQDRLEADLGMTLLEAMSAMGDEFSYAQDRIAREGHLETASQRRSLRHLARLVDYELADGSGASVWLDVDVSAAGNLTGGDVVTDPQEQIHFEVGRGLADEGSLFAVDPARNSYPAHLFDDEATCLEAGATSLVIAGHHALDLTPDPVIDPLGKWVVLATHPTDPAVPERRWIVRVMTRVESTDVLQAAPITTLTWGPEHAVPFEMDLETLTVRANLVPATSGKTVRPPVRFRVGPASNPADPDAGLPRAVERAGANGCLAYPDTLPAGPITSSTLTAALAQVDRSTLLLFSLPGSDETPLIWLPRPNGMNDGMHPEVRLEREHDSIWTWFRALIGEESAKANDKVFTLEDGMWRRVALFHKPGGDVEHVDYASSAGSTIRFGENQFGLQPTDGSVFKLTFRLGGLARSNAASGHADSPSAHACVCAPHHESAGRVGGRRSRRAGADSYSRARGLQGGDVPRGASGGLCRSGRTPAVGAESRRGIPLHRELAHGVRHAGPAQQLRHHAGAAARSRTPARSVPAGRARDPRLRSRVRGCGSRNPRMRGAERVSQRSEGTRARSLVRPSRLPARQRVLRSGSLHVWHAAASRVAPGRHPGRAGCARRGRHPHPPPRLVRLACVRGKRLSPCRS
jgi:hypothetical protein